MDATTPAPTFRLRRIEAWSMRAGITEPSKWAKVAADLGLHGVSISAQEQSRSGAFAPFVSAAQAATACRRYLDVGVTPHLMLWPRPEIAHARALVDYVQAVYERVPELGSVDLDAEEQWTRSANLSGGGHPTAHLIRSEWPEGLILAVNGITAALPRIMDLVRVADVLWPQAYTSSKASQAGTPGLRQIKVFDTWRDAAHDSQRINMGLAAYSQEGAGGLHAAEAMRRAYQAAAERVEVVRYWSLQELAGGTDAAFVRARAAELRR